MACVHLHNYLQVNGEQTYSPQGSFDEENVNCGVFSPDSWRFNSLHLTPFQRVTRRASFPSRQVRDEFAAYFADCKCRFRKGVLAKSICLIKYYNNKKKGVLDISVFTDGMLNCPQRLSVQILLMSKF